MKNSFIIFVVTMLPLHTMEKPSNQPKTIIKKNPQLEPNEKTIVMSREYPNGNVLSIGNKADSFCYCGFIYRPITKDSGTTELIQNCPWAEREYYQMMEEYEAQEKSKEK